MDLSLLDRRAIDNMSKVVSHGQLRDVDYLRFYGSNSPFSCRRVFGSRVLPGRFFILWFFLCFLQGIIVQPFCGRVCVV